MLKTTQIDSAPHGEHEFVSFEERKNNLLKSDYIENTRPNGSPSLVSLSHEQLSTAFIEIPEEIEIISDALPQSVEHKNLNTENSDIEDPEISEDEISNYKRGFDSIFFSNIHYPELREDGSANPNMIVVTPNEELFPLLPFTINNTKYIIIPRGQLCFSHGNPVIDESASLIPLSQDEYNSSVPNTCNYYNSDSDLQFRPLFYGELSSFEISEQLYELYNFVFNSFISYIYQNIYLNQNITEDNSVTYNTVLNILQLSHQAVSEETLSYVHTIQNHEVMVSEDVVTSIAQVWHHVVESVSLIKSSIAYVESHKIEIDRKNVVSIARIEDNTIDEVRKLKTFTAHVNDNIINIDRKTSNFIAHVNDNTIEIDRISNPITAHINDNTIEVDRKTNTLTVHVQDNIIQEERYQTCSTAHIEDHSVLEERRQTESLVHIEDHCVIPIKKIVVSHPTVVEHEIKVNSNNLRTETTVESLHIDVVKVPRTVNLEIPVFEVQYNYQFLGNLTIAENQVVEVPDRSSINSDFLSDVESDPEISTESEDLQVQQYDATPVNTRMISSSSSSSDEEESEIDFFADISDDDLPSRLLGELACVDSPEQLRILIERWKCTKNRSCWNSNDDISHHPLVHIMIREDRWCGVGKFPCQCCCGKDLPEYVNLRDHMKDIHATAAHSNHIAHTISLLIDRPNIWEFKQREDNQDKINYRANVWICPFPKCNYFTSSNSALFSHIAHGHKQFNIDKNSFGWIWSTILAHIKINNRNPSCVDIMKPHNGFICPICSLCWAKDRKSVNSHCSKKHVITSIEGQFDKAIAVSCSSLMNKQLNEDEIHEAENQISLFEETFEHAKTIEAEERTRSLDLSAVEERNQDTNRRRRSEDQRRLNRIRDERLSEEYGNLSSQRNGITPERIVIAHQDHDHEPTNNRDSTLPNTNRDRRSYLNNTREELLVRARGWITKCAEHEDQIISFPKIWGKNKSAVENLINEAFTHEISLLLDKCCPDSIHPVDENFYLFEGCLSKINLILRRCIRDALHITLDSSLRRNPKRNRHEVEHQQQQRRLKETKVKNLEKIVGYMEALIITKSKSPNQNLENHSENLFRAINKILDKSDADIKSIIGNDIEDIRNLINDVAEHRNERMDYIKGQLDKLLAETGKDKAGKFSNIVRSAYAEDPSRALRWFITGDNTPECELSPGQFEDTYGKTWENQSQCNTDLTDFPVEMVINADSNKRLLELLYDEEMIYDAIMYRSSLSANGPDGISNTIWKLGSKFTVRIIKMITDIVIKSRKCPSLLKRCKTVMIYKKGDPTLCKSWRPITITPTLYRMWMVHISKCFLRLNSTNRFISKVQKGFIQTPNGAAEHGAIINELIQHTARNNRSLYLCAIDLEDAFGKVPHSLIRLALERKGFDKSIINMILATYKNTQTRILIPNKGLSSKITFNTGVKQGCPLSPVLFDLCIDMLLEKLDKQIHDGYNFNGMNISAQAYADDLILISESESGMNKLIDTVTKFCDCTNMKISTSKCQAFSYIVSYNRRSSMASRFKINGDDIPSFPLLGYIEYLGIPTAIRKSAKNVHARQRILEMERDVAFITTSPLTFSQKIDAIKRCILPKLEYELLNGCCNITTIKNLDTKIRSFIDLSLQGMSLPVDFFYTNWRDGGLGLHQLSERRLTLCIRLFCNLWFSQDEKTRYVFRECSKDEKRYRGIITDDQCGILAYRLDNNKHIVQTNAGIGTSNLYSRCLQALAQLMLDCNLIDANDISISNKISNIEHPNAHIDIKQCTIKTLLGQLNTILQKRHLDELSHHPLRGHTFKLMENSPLSNFFLRDHRGRMNDATVRFTILARTNSIFTGQHSRLSNRIRNPDTDFSKCVACGGDDSLAHRLNGCLKNIHKYKPRHDGVAEEMLTAFKEHRDYRNCTFHSDCTIRLNDDIESPLSGPESSKKPDIWFIHGNTLHIIEITIPYGSMAENGISTLTTRREEKIEKYGALLLACKDQLQMDIFLHVIIISSLGFIPEETLTEFATLLGKSKPKVKKLAKRCVRIVLEESRKIIFLWNQDEERNQDNTGTTDGTDDDDIHVVQGVAVPTEPHNDEDIDDTNLSTVDRELIERLFEANVDAYQEDMPPTPPVEDNAEFGFHIDTHEGSELSSDSEHDV